MPRNWRQPTKRLKNAARPRLAATPGDEAITSIRVEGANHTWGDQLTLLAKLYTRALQN